MDASTVATLVGVLSDGGPHAVIYLLVTMLAGMVWERRRLLAEARKREERMDQLIDEYHEAHTALATALMALKGGLDSVGDRLSDRRH